MSNSRRLLLAIAGVVVLVLVLSGAGLAASATTRGAAAAFVRRMSARIGLVRPAAELPVPSSVTLTVDTSHVIRPISPLIYGVSVAGSDDLVALGAQLNRWGGNPNTRYNWELGNAWSSARDYEFRNYGQDQVPSPGATAESASDRFVLTNRAQAVETEFTVPAMGWVARDGKNATQSVNVPADGGPPVAPGSAAIAGYDPTDNRQRTSLPSFAHKNAAFADPPDLSDDRVYQDEWIHHLVDRFGTADQGGVGYYVVDNEPDLWSTTHTDLHPVQTSYDDMLSVFLEYATAIKDVDPSAQVAGPALSGWTAYLYSARDRGSDNFRSHADRMAHGDIEFLPWWLDQVHQHDQQAGRRSLDVLDVHYYPQAPGVYSDADDPQTRGLRLRTTRGLWDPTYVDESWISEPVRLIPRMRAWIDQYYPGTRLAIGEWSWGGEKSMSGALAVADVLGIFGREGVDLASYWTFPPPGSPAARAFAMYTHYDARGDAFGDGSLAVSTDVPPDDVTSYASLSSNDGDLVIIAINKRSDVDLPATIQLNPPRGGSAELFRLGPGDADIQDVGAINADGSSLHLVLPASSISLVRLSPPG